ncbi:MAG: hypothetical protein J2P17_20845 [Mycobacterium sp.]|nr:hypothetical protein [Mycobacterium sp.]
MTRTVSPATGDTDAPHRATSSGGERGRVPRWARWYRAVHAAATSAAVTLISALLLAAASQTADGQKKSPAKHDLDQLNAVIGNIRWWLVAILATLATLFLTVGGLRYLAAGGDPGEIERSKLALKSAAIGYGLAVLAPLALSILQHIVAT